MIHTLTRPVLSQPHLLIYQTFAPCPALHSHNMRHNMRHAPSLAGPPQSFEANLVQLSTL
jgi:hypothetical protein